MSRLLNNKWFIAALVALALCYVLKTAVLPYLDDGVVNINDNATFYELTEEDDAPSQALSGGTVAINQLVWNDFPSRDPFSEQAKTTETAIKLGLPTKKVNKSRPRKIVRSNQGSVPKLTGFVLGNSSKFAILNGEIIGVGQLINNYKVLAINSTNVSLHRLTSSKIIILSLE